MCPSLTSNGINALTQNSAPLWVCVLTEKSHTKAATAANSSHPTGVSDLAQPAVVPPVDEPVGGHPLDDYTAEQPPEECGHGDVKPKTKQAEASCMASVCKSFVNRGFSAGNPEPGENQLVRFMIPVLATTNGGVWEEYNRGDGVC